MSESPTPTAEKPLADLTPAERALLRRCATLRAKGKTWTETAVEVEYGPAGGDPVKRGDALERRCRARHRAAWQEALEEAEAAALAECHRLWLETIEGNDKLADKLTAARDLAADVRKGQQQRIDREAKRLQVEDVTRADPFRDLRGQGLEEAGERADRALAVLEGGLGHG